MVNRLPARTFIAGLLVTLAMSLGCNGPSPSVASPTSPTVTSPAAFFVNYITPNVGSTDGATAVKIVGAGFMSGTTLTLAGMATNVTVVSSTLLEATTPPHAAGPVDVVVTSPAGESRRLLGAYIYQRLSVASVSPTVGTTAGGTSLLITGTRFLLGVIVTLDGIAVPAYGSSPTSRYVSTPAHAAGAVDVVVTHPDGQADRLAGGYTFAPPESFDFNGTWDAYRDDSESVAFTFTIQNNALTRLAGLSCGGTSTFPPQAVRNGEFSFLRDDGASVSGRILSASSASGTMNVPTCGSDYWYAVKR